MDNYYLSDKFRQILHVYEDMHDRNVPGYLDAEEVTEVTDKEDGLGIVGETRVVTEVTDWRTAPTEVQAVLSADQTKATISFSF